MIIWTTGHPICHGVATALANHIDAPIHHVSELATNPQLILHGPHIGYGILRGMDGVFMAASRAGETWFEIDRGYFSRINDIGQQTSLDTMLFRASCMGTQAIFDQDLLDDMPLIKGGATYKTPSLDKNKKILLCPPTAAVSAFFRTSSHLWTLRAIDRIKANPEIKGMDWVVREKDSDVPLEDDLADTGLLITFNSSVGLSALMRGIPVLASFSSTIGSWANIPIEKYTDEIYPKDSSDLVKFLHQHDFNIADSAKFNQILGYYGCKKGVTA